MFTQLFGYYLLDKGVVTLDQLGQALAEKSTTNVKLGALAIDSGYMTAEQVDRVHDEQKHVDKKIGDIAVALGFITEEQVKELLTKQKTSNIILSQALIDRGYISNSVFENELKEYKRIAEFDEGDLNDKNLAEDIISIYDLYGLAEKDFYADYISLLVRNVVRFIGDDFAFLNVKSGEDIIVEYVTDQELHGSKTSYTAIGGDEKAFLAFASRYAGEQLNVCNEYACTAVGEFLNLQNSLYAENEANLNNVDLSLLPQSASKNKIFTPDKKQLIVPLSFTFGNMYVCFRTCG